MPPRKSNVSAPSNGAEDGTESPPPAKQKEKVGIEELSLPKSMIQRLAKGVLPANTQIQKDALAALHKSATVFVSYIAATANENAQAGGKKTISPQDVMAALKEQEYEDFLPRCEAELKKYNETQCDKRNTYRHKVKEAKDAAKAKADGEGAAGTPKDGETTPAINGTTNGHVNGDDAERPAKKARGEGGVPLPVDVDGADEDVNGEHEDDHDADEQDEEVEEEAADEEDGDEDDEDETMEDAVEELEDRGELRDEALDEPDSD